MTSADAGGLKTVAAQSSSEQTSTQQRFFGQDCCFYSRTGHGGRSNQFTNRDGHQISQVIITRGRLTLCQVTRDSCSAAAGIVAVLPHMRTILSVKIWGIISQSCKLATELHYNCCGCAPAVLCRTCVSTELMCDLSSTLTACCISHHWVPDQWVKTSL